GDIDRHVEHQVVVLPSHDQLVAFPLDRLLHGSANAYVQVPRHLATVLAVGWVALTGEANLSAVVNSDRHAELESLRDLHPAAPMTPRTGSADDLAIPAAPIA